MHSCIFLHVENVARVDPTTEVVETEYVFQKEQAQEFEVADKDQVLETDFANSFSQQSKHRFILNPVSIHLSLSLLLSLLILVH